jgi:hypothetical protein
MKKIFDEEFFAEDENIYSEESREMMLDDGELSPTEEAFMKGYDQAM